MTNHEGTPGNDSPAAKLSRVLTLGPLIFYGLGVIVGAGIYVALGAVIDRAGAAAPWSFLLAGAAAALTGLCYAELGSRFPEAAGAVAYVRHGFASDVVARATGAVMAAMIAISAASIARGAVIYLTVLVPLPASWLGAALIVAFTLTASSGVRASVGLAAAIGAVEILGLAVATLVGWTNADDLATRLAATVPTNVGAWLGVASGAFIAFFAFIGFESISNLAEEVKNPRRNVPRGIVASIAVSALLYIAVATAAVVSGETLHAGDTPLIEIFASWSGAAASLFAGVGFLAVANGVLVEIVMLSRLFYGMAHCGQMPSALALVDARTHTPVRATVVAGALVLVVALAIPFEHLLVSTNAITLALFALVDLALWRVKRRHPATPDIFSTPTWVAPLAAATSLALLVAELLAP